ncbi:MAG: HD domain-containing protein [Anaeromyxobacteraceae bacterium]
MRQYACQVFGSGVLGSGSSFVRPDGKDGSQSIHGVGHVWRVGVHARELAEALRLPPWEREALRLAALWHDIGRTCDGRDDFHGAKSAGKVVGLGLHRGVRTTTLAVALFAVTYHSAPDPVGEEAVEGEDDPDATLRVFRLLKDADGLDRLRLGEHKLDVRQLRHAESRHRVARARELLRGHCPSHG